MGQYRITIDRLDNETDEPTVRVITLTTRYTLQDDLAEWVTEEVDSDAEISDIPREDSPVNNTDAMPDDNSLALNVRWEMGDNPPQHIYGVTVAHNYDVPNGAEGMSLWLPTH